MLAHFVWLSSRPSTSNPTHFPFYACRAARSLLSTLFPVHYSAVCVFPTRPSSRGRRPAQRARHSPVQSDDPAAPPACSRFLVSTLYGVICICCLPSCSLATAARLFFSSSFFPRQCIRCCHSARAVRLFWCGPARPLAHIISLCTHRNKLMLFWDSRFCNGYQEQEMQL